MFIFINLLTLLQFYTLLATSPLASGGFAPIGNLKKIGSSGTATYFEITA